jgi:DNA replication and repair protein RecF
VIAAGVIRLARLALTDFRSYAEVVFNPGPGLVALVGENGAGKTNLLEAVSLLAPGRGLRQATLSEIARSGGPGGFAVSARLDAPGGAVDIGTGTTAAQPERRLVRINGAPAAAATLAEWLSVLWLTPAMDRLFVEGAGGRRRFLDRLVLALDPAHGRHATRYEAAMRSRNKLLAEQERADPSWLAALEAAMAEHGAALASGRTKTVAALSERLAAQPAGPFARAGLSLSGWIEASADPVAALADELRAGRSRDAAAGRALAGPQRTDLAAVHLDKGQPAERSSTGEQKALLIGLILAHADLVAEASGRRPLLLLDEVAAHLDPRRRAALFERLSAGGGQVLMTGTDRELFTGLAVGAIHVVAAGRIDPLAAG